MTDPLPERGRSLAGLHGCRLASDWRAIAADPDIDSIVISIPCGLLLEIATASLAAGKHVLIEKPPGRNLAEARALEGAAGTAPRVLKVGFNHRYHPALSKAHELFSGGLIGHPLNLRACYGHGGRPGYANEWRSNKDLAGGGELNDQGVHIADLVNWFLGLPVRAYGVLQTAVWPIEPLEDNAFGLLRFSHGAVASLHTSWTQWKNVFSFELFGQRGSLMVEGLGGSYGTERLVIASRNMSGGKPELSKQVFDEPDRSWEREWDDFVSAALDGESFQGTARDGVAAMSIVDALYRSATQDRPVEVDLL